MSAFELHRLEYGGRRPVARPVPLPPRGAELVCHIGWGLNWLAEPGQKRRLVVQFTPSLGRRRAWDMVARLYVLRTVVAEVKLDKTPTIGAGLSHLATTWDKMLDEAPVSEGVRNSLIELAGVITEPARGHHGH